MENLYKGKSNEQSFKAFLDFIDKLKSNGHTLKSYYYKATEKVLVDFNCGHEAHLISPNKYKSGRKCPKCSKVGKSFGRDTFYDLVKANGHKALEEYVNAKTKVLIDFNCGHKPSSIRPDHYKKNSKCPKCASNNAENAKNEFLKLVKINNHKLLSDYISTHEKVLIDFNCGHKPHWISPAKYKSGRGCPKCPDITQVNAKNRFMQKIDEEGFTLLSEYNILNEKVLIDFNCGHEPHWILPSCILSGQACPKCKSSKGVKRIINYLESQGLSYETELNIGNDRFYDIYIPKYNVIVEVHGEQHYVENKFFKRTLKEEQENDEAKEKYAKKLKYNYIVVDYREHDPELSLTRFIKSFNDLIQTTK